MTLTEIANKYALDKGTEIPNNGNHHGPRLNFTPIYEKYFNQIKNQKLNILEIGIENGNSLKLWKEYFENSNIFGFDINDKSYLNNDKIHCFQVDQSNKNQIFNAMNKINQKFDIIIDDGSHVISHQQISLGVLFNFLNKNGMYWIEDLHTSDENIWKNKYLYGNNMSFKPGTSTVNIIDNYIQNKIFYSEFLTIEENEYLNKNIEKCEIFNLGETIYGINKIAYFRKK